MVHRYDLIPVVFSRENLQLVTEEARAAGARFHVHLKIDTGMNRIGVRPEEAAELCLKMRDEDVLVLDGIMSHLATMEPGLEGYAGEQIARLAKCVDELRRLGIDPGTVHVANSGAILSSSGPLFDAVRPGIVLYGSTPSKNLKGMMDIRPVVSLVTKVVQVKRLPAGEPVSYGCTFFTRRESTIATIPLGYADGYFRLLSNRGEALVRGQRAPVVGVVCMDMTMIDVTDVPDVMAGDDVVAIGRQGDDEISVEEVAARAGTIPYEILTGIGPRVPRVYVGGKETG